MLTAMVVIIFAVAFFGDFLPKAKNQALKDSIVYCSLLAVSFVILILYSFDIVVPGPMKPIKNIVEIFIKPKK